MDARPDDATVQALRELVECKSEMDAAIMAYHVALSRVRSVVCEGLFVVQGTVVQVNHFESSSPPVVFLGRPQFDADYITLPPSEAVEEKGEFDDLPY